jgi:hypothetical protein
MIRERVEHLTKNGNLKYGLFYGFVVLDNQPMAIVAFDGRPVEVELHTIRFISEAEAIAKVPGATVVPLEKATDEQLEEAEKRMKAAIDRMKGHIQNYFMKDE